MPIVHAVMSAHKATYTWDYLNAIDICRQCCGGHGYSMYSGIPALYIAYAPNVTLEGDNVLLSL